ncbi:MAG: hypothetical protein QXW20_07435 [Ignisphaera sp.]
MSDVIDNVSKDLRCETIEENSQLYMVCRDKDNKVVYKRKLIGVG